MATEDINVGGETITISYDQATISVDDSDASFFVKYTYTDVFGQTQRGRLTGTLPAANAMRVQIRNALRTELQAQLGS